LSDTLVIGIHGLHRIFFIVESSTATSSEVQNMFSPECFSEPFVYFVKSGWISVPYR
jgi:hypothetical protein